MKAIISVFGATGNLMYKKLLPAFSKLIEGAHVEGELKILCIGRRDYDLDDYLEDAVKHVAKDVDLKKLKPHLEYIKLDMKNAEDYKLLKTRIKAIDKNAERLFYLAVPPELFPIIAEGIHVAKIIEKGNDSGRIVFEKPFGEDMRSAESINKLLWKYFEESQIYRIDHYLGKEMIQNILVMRYLNKIFEHSWCYEAIESVKIIAKEKEGVMSRGGYYDSIGALKDMVQSHLMQMAALVAMEKPKTFDAEGIRSEKVKALKNIKISADDVLMGQYDGYQNEEKVANDSNTETFVYLKATIDAPRWQGVPFYFLTGKKLDEKYSAIIIEFKAVDAAESLYEGETVRKNRLIIKVAPEEGVSVSLTAKRPGLDAHLMPATLDYSHEHAFGNSPEAYEKLLLDLINKSATLFTRWDEIETSWQIIDEIKAFKKDRFIYKDYQEILAYIKKTMKEDLR